MNDTVFEQIMKIRASGETNMFAVGVVQRIAFSHGFNELGLYIKKHQREYLNFILTGKRETTPEKLHGEALFTGKSVNLIELFDKTSQGQDKSVYVIEKTVELDRCQYKRFSENLLDDFDFIEANKDLMYVDEDAVWHCILIKHKDSTSGILVESEGYPYARYAAIYKP
ncbi:MAG: DUF5049 domain-containing protein [Saccharofermentanales bacterium]